MKKLILTAATLTTSLMLATSASAYVNGVYLGGDLGWGDIHQSGFNDLPDNSSSDTGLAGRIYGGYKFNDYVALEAGFTKFSNMNANGSGFDSADNVFVSASGTIQTYTLDMVAKGILPLQHGFSLFATLGLAYINQNADVTVTVTGISPVSANDTQNTWAPTFGLGASYDITPNVVADVTWSHIQAVNNDNNNVGNTDLIGVGLSYHFG